MSDSGSGASPGVQNYQTSMGAGYPDTIRHLRPPGAPDPSALAWCWCNRDRRPQFPPQKLKNGAPDFGRGWWFFEGLNSPIRRFWVNQRTRKVAMLNPEIRMYPAGYRYFPVANGCQRH